MTDKTGLQRISISFPFVVPFSEECHLLLHGALDAICEDYERANPDRVMWVFGEGAGAPEGYSIWDDGASAVGEWDYTVCNIEITERERYEGEKTTQQSRLRKALAERDKFKEQVIDTCKRAEKAEARLRDETGWLVELVHLGRPMWLSLHGPHAYNWTGDSLHALRFGRAADAQAFVDSYVTQENVRVTDHEWIGCATGHGLKAALPQHEPTQERK